MLLSPKFTCRKSVTKSIAENKRPMRPNLISIVPGFQQLNDGALTIGACISETVVSVIIISRKKSEMGCLFWAALTGFTVAMIGSAAAFQETNKLLTSLHELHIQAHDSITCSHQITMVHVTTAMLASQGFGAFRDIAMMKNTTMMILEELSPLESIELLHPVAETLNSSLSIFNNQMDHLLSRTLPLVKAIFAYNDTLRAMITNTTRYQRQISSVYVKSVTDEHYILGVAKNISMLECDTERSGLLENLEASASGMDATPNMVIAELNKSVHACHHISAFLSNQTSKVDNLTFNLMRVIDTVNTVKGGLDAIHELVHKLNEVLETRICERQVKKFAMEQLKSHPELIVELLASDKINQVFTRFGRKRRSLLSGFRNVFAKKKPERCVTVGQLLGKVDIPEVPGFFKTMAENVIRDFILSNPSLDFTMVSSANLSTNFMESNSTSMSFENGFVLDLDFEATLVQLKPDMSVIDSYLAMDYQQTFWENPVVSNASTPHTCPDETPLVQLQQPEHGHGYGHGQGHRHGDGHEHAHEHDLQSLTNVLP